MSRSQLILNPMADRHNRFAKKSLGQNFLTDQAIIEKIVSAVELSEGDTAIEIGPGRGALTEHLIEKAGTVIAIELDRQLVPFLREQFSDKKNFHVLEEDVLQVNFEALLRDQSEFDILNSKSVKLVANLPYYISTAILQRLAEQRECFSSLVLMFQREVVDRITALPSNSDRGFLTVIVEAAFSVKKLLDVPPTAFEPQPKIWSSVVRLTPKERMIKDESRFRRLVSDAFGQKRKTILNNLKEKYPTVLEALNLSNIDPKRRAETLTLPEWIALHDILRQK